MQILAPGAAQPILPVAPLSPAANALGDDAFAAGAFAVAPEVAITEVVAAASEAVATADDRSSRESPTEARAARTGQSRSSSAHASSARGARRGGRGFSLDIFV